MITLIEREREQNQGSNCSKCLKWADSLGKCDTLSCENYWKKKDNRSPSNFKGFCKQCGRNDYLVDNESCISSCFWTNFRLNVQQRIKEESLEAVQNDWKQKKTEIERLFRNFLSNLERTDPSLAKVIKKNKDEMIEAVEGDLYPNRNKNKGSSAWIWVLVIVGVIIIVGLGGWFWYKKSKTKQRNG